jgi:hypothetical protein
MPRKIVLHILLFLLTSSPILATPEFGRRYNVNSCVTCHTVVPKLNERGYDFLARGYRPDPELNLEREETFPLSVWLAGRADHRIGKPKVDEKVFFNKIELIAGDSIGDQLNYFVEWRALSLETRSDGSLKDRSGRFEDLWLSWMPDEHWTITAGQFRPLQQIEPGRKISLSTPAIFSTSLPGEKDPNNSRLTSLRKFSTSSRSPALSVGYQSVFGDNAADGLFHAVTLTFPGEISVPLTPEARVEASHEFESSLKGVVMETYYRKGLNSVGVHGFVGDNRWMAALVGEANAGDVFFLGGVGLDHLDGRDDRWRASLGLEYLPQFEESAWRPGVGFRVDTVQQAKPAYVPYLVLSGPNDGNLSSLLQLEYYAQSRNERLRLDWSIFF